MDRNEKKGISFQNRKALFVKECTEAFMKTYEEESYYIPEIHGEKGLKSSRFVAAFERFAEELEAVLDKGYVNEYVVTRMVMEYAAEKKRLVIATGNGAYSLLAYLYGITDIDPVQKAYPPEMFFKSHMSPNPYFCISVPESFSAEIVEYLKDQFGEENVSESEFDGVTVKCPQDANASAVVEVTFGLITDRFLSYAENCLLREDMDIYEKSIRSVLSSYIDLTEAAEEDIRDHKEEFLDDAFDGTFEGLVRTIAMIRGRGVWRSVLNRKEGEDRWYTRDDVYGYCKKRLGDKERAFRTMERIRNGGGVPEDEKAGFESDPEGMSFLSFCKGVGYMVSEGSCLSYAKLLCHMTEGREEDLRNH